MGEEVVPYLAECLGNVDTTLVGVGLAGSLGVYALLCTVLDTYYASHAVLLAGTMALAVVGTQGFLDQPMPNTVPLDDEAGPASHLLSHIMLIYQLFNLVVTFQVKELQSTTMALHHAVTILLAVTSLRPFALGYAAYFFGVVELSNFPLTVRDVIDHYSVATLGGAAPGPRLALTKTVAEGVFVLTFFGTRVFGWGFVSYGFWLQCAARLDGGVDPGTKFAVWLFLLSNAFLSALQVKWSFDIMAAVAAVVAPSKKGESEKAQ